METKAAPGAVLAAPLGAAWSGNALATGAATDSRGTGPTPARLAFHESETLEQFLESLEHRKLHVPQDDAAGIAFGAERREQPNAKRDNPLRELLTGNSVLTTNDFGMSLAAAWGREFDVGVAADVNQPFYQEPHIQLPWAEHDSRDPSAPSGAGNASSPTGSGSVEGSAVGAGQSRSARPSLRGSDFLPLPGVGAANSAAGFPSTEAPQAPQSVAAGESAPDDSSGDAIAAGTAPAHACGLLPPDFNRDASVADDDLATWEGNFGNLQLATSASGDADLDTDADGSDFLAWQRDFGKTTAQAGEGLPTLCPLAARDDGDWGHAQQGAWQVEADALAWQGDVREASAGGEEALAHWSATLPGGTYELFATWTASADNATDAPYRILDGDGQVGAVTRDHTAPPDDGQFLGVPWKSLGKYDFPGGNAQVELRNSASGSVIADGILFVPISASQPLLLSARLANDTGSSPTDGLTNDPTIVGVVSGGSGAIALTASVDGGPATSVAVDAAGRFVFDPGLPRDGTAEGAHAVRLEALAGSGSPQVVDVLFTLDTVAPATLELELDPAFDSPPLGDGVTTFAEATYFGTTEPGATVFNLVTGDEAIAGGFGQFLFAGIPLAVGVNTIGVTAADAAGNLTYAEEFLTRDWDGPLELTEAGQRLSRIEIPIALGPNDGGTRTIEFDVAAQFDLSDTGSDLVDTFSVYLIDPDTEQTLIDRGVRGETLFTLDERGPSTAPPAPGVDVTGNRVTIYVSQVGNETPVGMLVLELINGDGDGGSTVSVTNLTSVYDALTTPTLIVPALRAVTRPGGASSGETLAHPAPDIEVTTDNLRFDPASNEYAFDLRVRNLSSLTFGPDIAIAFGNLPTGAFVTEASGFDDAGRPYVNLAPALPELGLPVGAESERLTVRIRVDDPAATALAPVFEAYARLPILEIYENVLNRYDFQPYRGAMKGAQGVRETGRGNAWDMSSLLVEEFRAAGIPAEFAFDRVQIPGDLAINWLGAANLAGALEILTAAGLQPAEVFASGSEAVEFDHAWVVANVAFPGESPWWLDFDPSIKQYERQTGISDIVADVPFDIDAYLARQSPLDAAEYYANQVSDYLGIRHPGASLADVPQVGEIVPRHADALPAGVLFTFDGNPFTAVSIPVHETHRVLVEIRTTFFGNTTTYASRTFSLPDEGRDRITITWESGGVPFSVIPKIRLDGDLPAGGQALSFGTPVDLVIGIFNAGDLIVDTALTRKIVAGETAAVALDANQISDAMLLNLQDVVHEAGFNRLSGELIDWEKETGALLSLLGAQYFSDSYADAELLLGLTGGRRNYNDVSVAFLAGQGNAVDPEQMFVGIPKNGLIDVLWQTLLVSPDGDHAHDQARQRLVGVNSSDHERRVFERQLAVEGVSTIRVLQAANEAGIPVFTIDASNRALLEPQLRLSAQARAEIAQQLNLGYAITAPERSITIGDWIGTGWIVDGPFDDGFRLLGNLGTGNGGVWYSRIAPLDEFCFHPQPATLNQGRLGNRNYVDVVGNLFRSATDIALPAIGIPLEFERFYASSAQADVGLGVGWNHTWGHRLEFPGDGSVVWVTPHQHGFRFLPDGSGGFVTPDLLAGTLTELPDGSFSYRHKDGLTRHFDGGGQFQEVHDRFGNRVTLSYDAGRLTSVDHQTSGVSLEFSYVDDHISSVTDYAGRTWHYDYDQLTHPYFGVDYFTLSQVTSPSDAATAAVVTGYSYYNDEVSAGWLAEIVDPDGLAETFQYAANGKVLSTSHPETGTLTFAYDFAGKTTTATDARGFRWRTYYDDEGQIVREDRENDLQQMVRTATYSWLAGNLTSTTDALGHTRTYTYDALDNVVQTVDPLGSITSTAYDPQFSLPLTLTEPGGRVTTRQYDAVGNEIASVDPEGNLATATYDAHGQQLTLTSPRGAETGDLLGYTTTYAYNALGLVTSFTTGLPRTETFEYDAAGNLIRATDANGNASEYAYDRLDRLVAQIDPLGNAQRTFWDVMSRPVLEIDPAGRRTAVRYDRVARTEETIFDDHSAVRSRYDTLGNVTAVRDERGFTTHYEFDSRERLTAVVHPDGARQTQSYDDADRLIVRRDARGNAETFAYDALYRVIRQTDPLGGVRESVYDPHGNLVQSIDELGRSYAYQYDQLDRLVATRDPLGGVHQFAFDAHGNLVSSTDVLGRVRTMTYDADDRLVAETDPLGGVRLRTYDALGNLLAETDENGHTTSYEYDPLRRAVVSVDPLGNEARVSYDPVGNPIATEDRLGRSSEFQYDAFDRVVRAVDPVGGFEEWTYDAAGNLSAYRDKRGFVSTFEYDGLNRLVRSFDPFGAQAKSAYDADGNLVEFVDELGRITTYEYDALNRVVSSTDAAGGVRTTQYDAAGNVVEETDELGRTTLFAYDDLNRLTATTDPAGGVRQTAYDLVGNVTSVVDQNGRTTQFAYDALNRIVGRTDAIGGAAAFAYDSVGNLTLSVDELGRSTQFAYDANDRLQSQTNAAGGVRTFQYDAVGNLAAVADELGRPSLYAYDGLNRLVQSTDAIGGTRSFTYDQTSNLASATDPLGRTTSYLYDGLGRLIVATDPLGQSRFLGWDAVGNLVAATDELGRLTQFQYDNLNRHVRTIDPLGGTTERAWDAAGNLVASSDELGRTSTYAYDPLDRLVESTDPLGRTTSFQHDGVGNLAGTTDPLGRQTTYAHDGLNRLIEVTDALDGVRSYAYDGVGNLLAQTDEIGRTTTRVYDVLNRVVSHADPLGNSTQWSYDAVGNALQTIDPRGQATNYAYDDLNRLVSIADPLAGVTQYAYDAASNLTEVIDPVGNATAFAYDALDRQVGSVNALGGSRSFAYDAVGNLVETTDRNGRVIRYAYDALDRRTQEQWLDGNGSPSRSFAYAFDAADQLASASDPAATYSYLYDDAGRMTQSTQAGPPAAPAVAFAYSWDDADNLVARSESIAGLATASVAWIYDALDRPTRITQSGSDSASKRVDLGWDAASQPLSVVRFANLAGSGQALETSYVYDAAGRLTALDHAQGPANLASYSWTYDAADRLIQATDPDGTVDYSYDDRNQLITADHSSKADEVYAYDEAGNRTLAGYQTGVDNRLLSDGAFDYEYDAEGNRTRRTEIASGEVTEYAWDHRNRLTSVRTFDAGATLQSEATYEYDLYDNRIARTVDPDGAGPALAETEHLVYDGAHLALSFDQAGNRTHRYLHGPAIDQVLADEDAAGNLLWPLADHLGSIRDLADAAGTNVNHLAYDSFGNVMSESNPLVDHRFQFTGREFDEESGLFQYRARYYDAAIGRFISQDPIGFAAGDANLYRYVGNHPVYATDASGLAEDPDEEEEKEGLKAVAKKLQPFQLQTHERVNGVLQQVTRSFDGAGRQIGEAARQLLATVTHVVQQANGTSSSAGNASDNTSFTPTVGPVPSPPASSPADSPAAAAGPAVGSGALGGGGPRPDDPATKVAERPFANAFDRAENASDEQFDKAVKQRLASKRPTAELEAGGMLIARAQKIAGQTVREQLNQAARDRNYVDKQIDKVLEAASKDSSLLKTRIGKTLEQLKQLQGSGRYSEVAKALANSILGALEGGLAKAGQGLNDKLFQTKVGANIKPGAQPSSGSRSSRSALVEVGAPPSSVGDHAPIVRVGSKEQVLGPRRPTPPPLADGSRGPVVAPTPGPDGPGLPGSSPAGRTGTTPLASPNVAAGGDTVPVGAGAAAPPPGAAPLARPHISGGPIPAPPIPEVTMITASQQPRLILQSFNGKEHVRVETWDGKHLYTADRQTFELLQQKVPSPPAALPAARPRVNLSVFD